MVDCVMCAFGRVEVGIACLEGGPIISDVQFYEVVRALPPAGTAVGEPDGLG